MRTNDKSPLVWNTIFFPDLAIIQNDPDFEQLAHVFDITEVGDDAPHFRLEIENIYKDYGTVEVILEKDFGSEQEARDYAQKWADEGGWNLL